LTPNNADCHLRDITETSNEAHRSSTPRDRSSKYERKAELIAKAILEVPSQFIHLNYQIRDGQVFLLTTLIGSLGLRAFHTPLHQLPGDVLSLVLERLGSPYAFFEENRDI
jgi:hypothetical protein